jgi:hypothetical protein
VKVVVIVGASLLALVGAAKCVELLVDMWWTWCTGPRFAAEVRRVLADDESVDIARIEREHGRPQPVYAVIRRLPSATLRRVLGHAYRAYGVVTALSAVLLFGAALLPDFLLVAGAAVLMTMANLFMANALLRRLQLGAVDALNRDLAPDVASDQAVQAAVAGRRIGFYFLGLVYVIIVGYAGVYAAVNQANPAAFTNQGNAPAAVVWTYYSVVTTATVGFGDVHPTGTWGFVTTMAQIMAGPLLLAWLISAFGTTVLPTPGDRARL